MESKTGTHKDLQIWHEGLSLVEQIYCITAKFPSHETYALTSQMRRAAVSIPSNIAEGAARQTGKEFIQFLYIALGSASELDTQIEVSREIGLGDSGALLELQKNLDSISKMLQGLIRAVKNSANH